MTATRRNRVAISLRQSKQCRSSQKVTFTTTCWPNLWIIPNSRKQFHRRRGLSCRRRGFQLIFFRRPQLRRKTTSNSCLSLSPTSCKKIFFFWKIVSCQKTILDPATKKFIRANFFLLVEIFSYGGMMSMTKKFPEMLRNYDAPKIWLTLGSDPTAFCLCDAKGAFFWMVLIVIDSFLLTWIKCIQCKMYTMITYMYWRVYTCVYTNTQVIIDDHKCTSMKHKKKSFYQKIKKAR